MRQSLGMRQKVWERDYPSTTKVRSKKVHSKLVQRNLVEFHLKQMSVPNGNTAYLEHAFNQV